MTARFPDGRTPNQLTNDSFGDITSTEEAWTDALIQMVQELELHDVDLSDAIGQIRTANTDITALETQAEDFQTEDDVVALIQAGGAPDLSDTYYNKTEVDTLLETLEGNIETGGTGSTTQQITMFNRVPSLTGNNNLLGDTTTLAQILFTWSKGDAIVFHYEAGGQGSDSYGDASAYIPTYPIPGGFVQSSIFGHRIFLPCGIHPVGHANAGELAYIILNIDDGSGFSVVSTNLPSTITDNARLNIYAIDR